MTVAELLAFLGLRAARPPLPAARPPLPAARPWMVTDDTADVALWQPSYRFGWSIVLAAIRPPGEAPIYGYAAVEEDVYWDRHPPSVERVEELAAEARSCAMAAYERERAARGWGG